MSDGQNKEGILSPKLETGQTLSKPVVSVQIHIPDEELTGGLEGLTGEELKAILEWTLMQAREEAAAHLPGSSSDKAQELEEIHMHRQEHSHRLEAGDLQGSGSTACVQHSQKEDSGPGYGEGPMHRQEHTQTEGHTHGQEASRKHGHTHPNSKAVSNRLAKAIGHLESVKRMVDRGDDCADILIQLAAVRSAINNAGKVLLIDHLNHCIVDAVEDGDLNAIDDFSDAIWKFVK